MGAIWLSVSASMPVVISVLSFFLSGFTLLITYQQKVKQDRLLARKSLTDAISSIVGANTEMTKLFSQPATEQSVSMRRNINSHRRNVADHADLLISEIPQLATDADHYIVASAFDSFGDFEKADFHWRKAVDMAKTPITMCIAQRVYGRFLFPWGKIEPARDMFTTAIKQLNTTDDRNRRERADTFALWALTERDAGYNDEAAVCRSKALKEASHIQSESSRVSITEYIDKLWNPEKVSINIVTNDPDKHPSN